MPKYTLRYFDVRARGEIIRLLFTLKGIDFEDTRFTGETWPAEKPKTPFGQLPVLTVDGKELTESAALERYLAREFGFYGSTHQEAYEIDEVLGICKDLFDKFAKIISEKDEAKKPDLKKAFDEEMIPRYIGNIEKLMSKKQKGYCIGKKLSLGDIAIFDVCDGKLDDAGLTKYPYVKAIVDNVKSNDKIKAYLAKRKQTAF